MREKNWITFTEVGNFKHEEKDDNIQRLIRIKARHKLALGTHIAPYNKTLFNAAGWHEVTSFYNPKTAGTRVYVFVSKELKCK